MPVLGLGLHHLPEAIVLGTNYIPKYLREYLICSSPLQV